MVPHYQKPNDKETISGSINKLQTQLSLIIITIDLSNPNMRPINLPFCLTNTCTAPFSHSVKGTMLCMLQI